MRVVPVKRDNAAIRQAITAGKPDMYFWSWWMDYPDIENALKPCFHSSNIPFGGNGCHFRSPAFDAAVAAAEAEPDPGRRIAKFQRAEDIILDECPWVFLYHRRSYTVVQPWVRNFEPALMFNAGRAETVDIDLALKPR